MADRRDGKALHCEAFHRDSGFIVAVLHRFLSGLSLRRLVIAILVGLLVAKVACVVARGPSPLVMDAGSYWRLGDVAWQGDWLLFSEPIAYRTPIYPWLIAVIRGCLPAPLLSLVCVQAMLWLATVAMIVGMARDISRDDRAIECVLLLAAPMISSVLFISAALTETLFVFALVLHLWSMMRYTREPTVGGATAWGLTFAFAVLTRPIAALIWMADLIYLVSSWYVWKDDRAEHLCRVRGWIGVAVATVVVAISFTPGLYRNYAMFGEADADGVRWPQRLDRDLSR